MADKNKKEAEKETPKKASVKTTEVKLKVPYNGKKAGDKVSLGPEGLKDYKRKNLIE